MKSNFYQILYELALNEHDFVGDCLHDVAIDTYEGKYPWEDENHPPSEAAVEKFEAHVEAVEEEWEDFLEELKQKYKLIGRY